MMQCLFTTSGSVCLFEDSLLMAIYRHWPEHADFAVDHLFKWTYALLILGEFDLWFVFPASWSRYQRLLTCSSASTLTTATAPSSRPISSVSSTVSTPWWTCWPTQPPWIPVWTSWPLSTLWEMASGPVTSRYVIGTVAKNASPNV